MALIAINSVNHLAGRFPVILWSVYLRSNHKFRHRDWSQVGRVTAYLSSKPKDFVFEEGKTNDSERENSPNEERLQPDGKVGRTTGD